MSGGLGIGYSQPSGTNLVVNGNVSIGTASPTQKLDVVGIIRGDNFIIDNKKSCGKLYTDSNGNVKCGTDNVNDADSNPTNEIQRLSKSGSRIYLSNNGGSVTLNDDSTTNEIQRLSKIGSRIYLSNNGGSIILNDDSSTNELQNLYSVLSRGAYAGYKRITSFGYPIYSSDAATKGYVDSKVSSSGGFRWGSLCRSLIQTNSNSRLCCNSNEYLVDVWVADYGNDGDIVPGAYGSISRGYGGCVSSGASGYHAFGILCCRDS